MQILIELIGRLIQFLLCNIWNSLLNGCVNDVKGKLVGIATERTPSIEIFGSISFSREGLQQTVEQRLVLLIPIL